MLSGNLRLGRKISLMRGNLGRSMHTLTKASSLGYNNKHNALTYQPNRTFFTAKEGTMCFFGSIFFVREQYACLVHRFQKYNKQVKPGLNFKIPFIDTIEYVHDLREQVIEISSQVAVTKDNVALHIDGVLYMQVDDAYKASYGVENFRSAISNLAQTTMRSEIGKLALDKTFEERDKLNEKIVNAIGKETEEWGVKCIRYEIKDIDPPRNIQKSMILQAEAERKKRAQMIESMGERQSVINLAEGEKESNILRAQGQAEAIIKKAQASGEALKKITSALEDQKENGTGGAVVNFLLGERYIDAYKKIAKENNTVFINSSPQNPVENVKESMNLLKVSKKR